MLGDDLSQRPLGRYQIMALLGRGGMASVYRAHDTILHRDVALKVLYPQYSDDKALVERFKREAILAARLDHPNIVPIYDVGEADGNVYIAMKLQVGRSLADVLRERLLLPLSQTLPIIPQITDALDYAHTAGVIHRDVKAPNILLSDQPGTQHPQALLTDFGIAKSLVDGVGLTSTSALIGTPGSMAPEQITKQPTLSQTDVYGLGALVFRCLTGRNPFEGSTEEVLLGHLYGTIQAPSTLVSELPSSID